MQSLLPVAQLLTLSMLVLPDGYKDTSSRHQSILTSLINRMVSMEATPWFFRYAVSASLMVSNALSSIMKVEAISKILEVLCFRVASMDELLALLVYSDVQHKLYNFGTFQLYFYLSQASRLLFLPVASYVAFQSDLGVNLKYLLLKTFRDHHSSSIKETSV